MPRGPKILIDEKIRKSEAALAKAKAKYDAEAAVLKELLQKRQAMRDRELMEAIAKSKRSFEEILDYIKRDSDAD
ncbi:hypothetical protein [Proteiniclasticum sp. QWL-01]|uniref:hypothetical protein n=1 Tax=Proteiniclasticum sp. QWL-01 TaxID=3036945 RepID=UPI00240EFF6A|nr:hypothetical protein [Proteiniclasticum sp. QWL-01]WFF72622.1 hypothetical protein P6M73_15325 [Proteiniclasticum sp. QWL-01]WFF72754.1 hypothetical protein P6M73_16010 [Proteiniclasticum sp. QWL-01]WFF73148.1 hypothetical protein P6M73_01385 [Proteiniclasticum sp. QWL-01]